MCYDGSYIFMLYAYILGYNWEVWGGILMMRYMEARKMKGISHNSLVNENNKIQSAVLESVLARIIALSKFLF